MLMHEAVLSEAQGDQNLCVGKARWVGGSQTPGPGPIGRHYSWVDNLPARREGGEREEAERAKRPRDIQRASTAVAFPFL